MATRDPQREQHWRALLGEWQQSGLSIYAFCKQRGLRKTNFYYWQRKLGFSRSASSAPPPVAAFVPMTLVAEPMVEIACAGMVLKLPLAASAECIARWLAATRAASC
jgi:hypothetical protein